MITPPSPSPFGNREQLHDESYDSLSAEEVGGEAVMEKHNDENIESPKSIDDTAVIKGRGGNYQYTLIQHFECKSENDKYWLENNYDKSYNFHDRGTNYLGEFEIYSVNITRKVGILHVRDKLK